MCVCVCALCVCERVCEREGRLSFRNCIVKIVCDYVGILCVDYVGIMCGPCVGNMCEQYVRISCHCSLLLFCQKRFNNLYTASSRLHFTASLGAVNQQVQVFLYTASLGSPTSAS